MNIHGIVQCTYSTYDHQQKTRTHSSIGLRFFKGHGPMVFLDGNHFPNLLTSVWKNK